MLEAKRFPVEEAVTHMVPFEETPTILEEWSREPERFTKIMVEVASVVLKRLSGVAGEQILRSPLPEPTPKS